MERKGRLTKGLGWAIEEGRGGGGSQVILGEGNCEIGVKGDDGGEISV